jgi:hypothetical protein
VESKPSSVPDELESVRILRLEPGDEIVLRVDARGIGPKSIERIKEMAEERWPGHRVTVMDRIDIEVVRA